MRCPDTSQETLSFRHISDLQINAGAAFMDRTLGRIAAGKTWDSYSKSIGNAGRIFFAQSGPFLV